MGIEQHPLDELLVHRLFELANTPFQMMAFQDRWAKYGWTRETSLADKFGLQVEVPKHWPLNVDPLGTEVISARLPICYWTDEDANAGYDRAAMDRQKAAFDGAFVAAVALARRNLPEPFLAWKDNDEQAHQARVWAGSHGVLILQQACFDPQFGLEINFWLESASRNKFNPTSPLIDWLCNRSQSIHEMKGFPPLP